MVSFSPFWSKLAAPAASPPRILFTDVDDPRVLDACRFLKDNKLVDPILVNEVSSSDRSRLETLLLEKQKRSNLSSADVHAQFDDTLYRGVAMLLDHQADGLVGGSLRPTADVVRAALQCIGAKPGGQKLVSGHFFIETEQRSTADQTPFLFADCAVVPEPSSRSLAAIAMGAAASYRFFTGQTPKIALLSFSTRGSAQHPLVDRIKEALEIIRKHEPNLIVDGELQVDAALDMNVAKIKNASDSMIAGNANVFVFPTLEAGNIGYKLVQRFSNARVAGPLLWGLDKPLSDLSRGCSVQEVIDSALCVASLAKAGR